MKPFYEKLVVAEIHPHDAGARFARCHSDQQAVFLNGVSESIARDFTNGIGGWAMQCRHIIEEMGEDERRNAAAWIEVLLEHLREPAAARAEGAAQ